MYQLVSDKQRWKISHNGMHTVETAEQMELVFGMLASVTYLPPLFTT